MPASPPGEVIIGLLGPLHVVVDGSPVDITGGKRRGVLARLAVTPSVVATDRLVDDLWPVEAAERAVGTVRTYCSQLRRVIGSERIRSTPPGYTLRDVELDARRFEQLVADARRADDLVDRVRLLDDAMALWRGPALVEFAEHPWARDEAARLDSLRLDAQHARFDARLSLGDHHALAGELQVVVANHPMDERFWAQLMLALYGSGRQADALRVYQRARHTLVDELGIEPGVELRELEGRIIAQDPTLLRTVDATSRDRSRDQRVVAGTLTRGQVAAPPTAPPVPPPTSLGSPMPSPTSGPGIVEAIGATTSPAPLGMPVEWSSTEPFDWVPSSALPFVGRDDELARGRRACGAPGTDLRVVLVEGEPGAGKTRLLAELAGGAMAVGQRVLFGRADEHLGDAYRLWGRVLDELGDAHPELAALLDESAAGDEPTTGDPDARRQRFFAGLARALTAAWPSRLVLVLDDLQWADVDSLRALRHVVLDAPRFPLTLLLAIRAGADAPTFRSTMELLERAGVANHIKLDGLDADAVMSLVNHAASAELDALAQRLWHDTGGNALFVTEVLRDRSSRAERADELDLPDSVRAIVRERVRALPDRVGSLLAAASVIGTAVSGPLIGEVAGLSVEDTIAALDEATASLLLAAVASEPGVFEFSHAVLRDAILDDVPPARRLDLHRRTALALENAGGIPTQARLAELARHWTEAGAFGDIEAAIRYRRLAGEAALRELGYEAAVTHFHGALELLDQNPPYDDPRSRAEILLALAATENRSGEIQSARDHCLTAAELATAAGEDDLFVRASLEIGGVLPTATGDYEDDDAAQLLQRARLIVDRGGPLFPMVCARLAQIAYWPMSKAQRRALCDEAIGAARAIGDRRLVAGVLLHRYWALNGPDEMDERLEIAAELDELAVILGDLDLSLQAGKCRLHAMLELGDFSAATTLQVRLARLADELQQPEGLRLALAFDAMRATVEGRFGDADRCAVGARNLLRARGRPLHALVAAYIEMVPKRWIQGRLHELDERSAAFVEAESGRSMFWAFRAAVCRDAGDLASARNALDRLDLSRFVDADPSIDFLGVLAMAAYALDGLDDAPQAKLAYDALAPYAERNAVTGQIAFYGCVAHHLGVLAATAGDRSAAAEHLDAALERHVRMGATPFVALSAAELARVLDARSDRRARAAELRDRARAIAAELDLGLVRQRLA